MAQHANFSVCLNEIQASNKTKNILKLSYWVLYTRAINGKIYAAAYACAANLCLVGRRDTLVFEG